MPANVKLWFALAMVAACGWGGYAYGKREGGLAAVDSGQEKTVVIPAAEARRASGRSADPMADFELLLEKDGLDPDLWKIVRRLSNEQVREALEKVKASPQRKILESLEKALYHRWAQSDPQAALAAALKENTPGRHNERAASVLCAWMKFDPEGAFRGTKGDKIQWTAAEMLTKTWTAENVFAKLKQFPEEEQKILFGKYCVNCALKPEARTQMLASLKSDSGLVARDWGYGQLFRNWVQNEPEGAFAELPNHDMPWLRKQMIEDGLNSQPAFTLAWAADNGVKPGGPTWEHGYSFWVREDPSGARAWLDGHAAEWNGENRQEVVTAFLAEDLKASRQRQQGDAEPAAALAKQWELWKAADPEAAERWRAGTDPEVAASLESSAHE